MIRRVKVAGYKSLRQVELSLAPLTVIFGPNAAGKSNLHDALGLLSRLVTGRTLREAFDPVAHRGIPIEAFTYGPKGLEGLLEAKQAEFTVEVDIELSDSVIETVETRIRQLQEGLPTVKQRRHVLERRLRYRVTVQILPETGVLRVMDEYLTALKKDGTPTGGREPFIERGEDDNRLHLRPEGQAHPTYHELGLDYTLASSPLYPPHYPHITALREEMSRWRFYYLEPDMMRMDTAAQDVGVLGRDGSELAPFYYTLKQQTPKKFEGLSKALRMLLPLAQDLDVELRPNGLLDLSLKESGIRFSSRVISEGTLRILGLLAITRPLHPISVVGYEEPENGVHPRRLKLIADLFENAARETQTQFLINTHSPFVIQSLQASPSRALIACTQDKSGWTDFGPVLPLFAGDMVQRILEGEYGG